MDENKNIENNMVDEILLTNENENENENDNDILYDNIYDNYSNILIKKPLSNEIKKQKYNFLNSQDTLNLLKNANDILNISKSPLNKIIFVYTHPKVGSTSLVTSIRMFASHIYNVIHIHDEEMLKKLSNISNITINEIILYNEYIGKEVFVIDVYRSPIERKISTFFEKIDVYHFNNVCENINNYNIEKIINRFNKIYPHIGNGDHFIDNYNIDIPSSFNHLNKYIHIEEYKINYIKLRLKDSHLWGDILTKLLKVNIKIVKDYETNKKQINNTYSRFKEQYKIPINYLEELDSCSYLNYYYTEKEKEEYFNEWSNKVDNICKPFSLDEYKLYEYISNENKYMNDIQTKHYLDEGCVCKACYIKRISIANKIINGEEIQEPIIHENARNELVSKRIDNIKKLKDLFMKNKDTKKIQLPMKLM
jgi:hypothetical protein